VTRVLVADDDADIRDLVQFKLTQSGFDVAAVGDGQTALEAVLADPPDLLVLDLMMPRLTGIEVCQALRSDDRTATVPVIMLTAKAQEADVTRGFGVGADDYVIKPFSPRELLTRVQAVLARTQR
jgi:DNA-binding response OmpR family regulator